VKVVSSVYTYRVLKSSWGVAIDVDAEVREGAGRDALSVGPGLWLRDATARQQLSPAVLQMLALGLRPLVTPIRRVTGGREQVVEVRALQYNDCDFQFEALAPAMYGWAVAEFGLTAPQVEVAFGGRERRYVFTLP